MSIIKDRERESPVETLGRVCEADVKAFSVTIVRCTDWKYQ